MLFYLLFYYGILSSMFCFQPDCLDDLAYAIMYETTKLAYRVSEADVIRARNQVVENDAIFSSCLIDINFDILTVSIVLRTSSSVPLVTNQLPRSFWHSTLITYAEANAPVRADFV